MVVLMILIISLDSFVIGFSYKCSNIKIPFLSSFVISLLCTLTFGLSLFFGKALEHFFSAVTIKLICFSILFSIGVFKIFEMPIKLFFKNFIDKYSIPLISAFIKVYSNHLLADKEDLKSLSFKETMVLGIVLSLDNLFSGIALNMNYFSIVYLCLLCFCAILF